MLKNTNGTKMTVKIQRVSNPRLIQGSKNPPGVVAGLIGAVDWVEVVNISVPYAVIDAVA